MVDIFNITENMNFSDMLPKVIQELPEWRRQKALSYRFDIDRFQCAKSFLILEELLKKEYGIIRCPEFSYGPFGKPYFAEYPNIHFNVSHCHKGIACAVSGHPVGIDIEEIQYDEFVAQRVLNTDEYAEVKASSNPAGVFTELWTKKESYLKLTGQGLIEDMRGLLNESDGIHFKSVINSETGYVCSIAYHP